MGYSIAGLQTGKQEDTLNMLIYRIFWEFQIRVTKGIPETLLRRCWQAMWPEREIARRESSAF